MLVLRTSMPFVLHSCKMCLFRTLALSILFFQCVFAGESRKKFSINVHAAKELGDLISNFTEAWNEYKRTWTSFHDSTSSEVLGYQSFACDTEAIRTEPKNVHMLRPGDIGVVAALGDSLISGSGAGGHKLLDVALEYRGVSFPIGGDGALEDTLTLPNILRKYNPKIYGASKFMSPADYIPFAQLNVAIPGSRARDMPDQARELVSRLRRSPKLLNMWKIVTIFIGANDLCQYCIEDEDIMKDYVSQWISNIETAVNILYQDLSKTFINLIPAPPVGVLRRYNDHAMCKLLHELECPCSSAKYENHWRTDELNRQYQSRLHDLLGLTERWDFTAVVQPFLTNALVPINSERKESDLSYLAPDCFHFSRRSHAAAAAALWNNMVQTTQAKNTTIDPANVYLICPDKECPYFRTSKNSVNCSVPLSSPVKIAATLRLINEKTGSGPGPAIWIFVGLVVALLVGVVILYCAWKGRILFKKKAKVPDENTPLIQHSAAI